MENLIKIQKQTTQKINDAAKHVIETKEELQTMLNFATRHKHAYEESEDQSDRRKALRYYAKAWRCYSRIIASQEEMRWNCRSAAEITKSKLNHIIPTLEDEVALKSDYDYYTRMFERVTAEQQEFIKQKREILALVRELRVSVRPVAVAI